MSRLHPSLLLLDKGLDLQSAKLLAPEGTSFDMLNYEQVDFQGQKRIDGYARYDGSPLSALDDFYVSDDGDITVGEYTPYDLAFYKGKPFGIQVAANRFAVIDHSNLPPGEWGQDVVYDPDVHYEDLLAYNQYLRERVEELPGKVIGLHWFKDRLYSVAGLTSFSYKPPEGPTIEGELGTATVGELYDGFTPTVSEGYAPVVDVTVADGSLPVGLSFDEYSVSAATPLKSGSYSVTWKAVDANGFTSTHTSTLVVECAGLLIGDTIGATYSMSGDYRSSYIFRLSNGNLGFATGGNGVSPTESYTVGELDSSLDVVSSSSVTWNGFTTDTARLWLRGINEDGIGLSADNSAGLAKLFDGGNEKGYYIPTSYGNDKSWWYSESSYSPEYGGLVWMDNDYIFLGVRKTDNGGAYQRKLLKLPIANGGPIREVALVNNVGTTTGPHFWMTMCKDNYVHIIQQDGIYRKFDYDLQEVENRASGWSLTDFRGFGVDDDTIALVYGGPSARVEFRSLSTNSIIKTIYDSRFGGNQATRVIFTDDSCYIQCRTWVGRVQYSRATCDLT